MPGNNFLLSFQTCVFTNITFLVISRNSVWKKAWIYACTGRESEEKADIDIKTETEKDSERETESVCYCTKIRKMKLQIYDLCLFRNVSTETDIE